MIFTLIGKTLYLMALGTHDDDYSVSISDFLITRIREHAAKLGASWIPTLKRRTSIKRNN
jgi:hypothetical protein